MWKASFFQLDRGQSPVYTSPRGSVGTLYDPVSTGYHERGFTLVEIIVTFLLVSILSVVVISRLSSSAAFNGVILRDQIIALTRLGQQSAFGRSDVELRVTPDGSGDASLVLSDANGIIQSNTIAVAAVDFRADVDVTASCSSSQGAAVTSGAPLIIAFGELGDATSAGVGTVSAVNTSVRICIDAAVETSVCVSSAGYAYVGDCNVD